MRLALSPLIFFISTPFLFVCLCYRFHRHSYKRGFREVPGKSAHVREPRRKWLNTPGLAKIVRTASSWVPRWIGENFLGAHRIRTVVYTRQRTQQSPSADALSRGKKRNGFDVVLFTTRWFQAAVRNVCRRSKTNDTSLLFTMSSSFLPCTSPIIGYRTFLNIIFEVFLQRV